MPGGSPERALERVARPLSETLLARSVELASQALLLLLVPRALGSADYGSFAAAFAAMSVVSIGFGLGAPLAAMRYVPGADPVERAGLARAVARHVAIGRARALAALTTLAVLLAFVVPGANAALVATVCLAGWFSVASSIAAELALALERTRLWNARFVLENLLVVLAAIAGHAALGTTGAIVGLAVAAALTFVVLAAGIGPVLRGAAAGIELPAGLGRYARLETASVLIVTVVLRGSPVAMLLLGAATLQVGYGAIATGVAAAGTGVVLSLVVVRLPRLADLARSAPALAEREARRSAIPVSVVAAVVGIPAALFAGPAIDVALGEGFAGARDAVALALCVPPLAAAVGLAGQLAALRMRPELRTAIWIGGGLVFALVTLVAVPALGAEGAALAVVSAFAVAAVASVPLVGAAMRAPVIVGLTGAAAVLVAALAGAGL